MTRTAMRVAADEGSEDDWFAWLKCGLLPLEGWEGEELENCLRAGRWAGRRWLAEASWRNRIHWVRRCAG